MACLVSLVVRIIGFWFVYLVVCLFVSLVIALSVDIFAQLQPRDLAVQISAGSVAALHCRKPMLPYNAATEHHVPWRASAAPALPSASSGGGTWAAAASSASSGGGTWAAAMPQASAAASQPVATAAAAHPVAATSAVSPATPGPAAHLGDDLRPLWQVQDEFGHWIDYDVACNTFLEKSFQEGLKCVQHTPGKAVVFTYFLSSFVQQNEETKKRRVMRRVLIQSRMQESLAEISKHCEEHNKDYHTLEDSHRRTSRVSKSRSPSRARSMTRA